MTVAIDSDVRSGTTKHNVKNRIIATMQGAGLVSSLMLFLFIRRT